MALVIERLMPDQRMKQPLYPVRPASDEIATQDDNGKKQPPHRMLETTFPPEHCTGRSRSPQRSQTLFSEGVRASRWPEIHWIAYLKPPSSIFIISLLIGIWFFLQGGIGGSFPLVATNIE